MKLRPLIFLGWSVLAGLGEESAKPELSPEAEEILNRDGFVVVDKSVRQGFSAYINADHPVFVTSDSLLMAWHRIHEEILRDFEIKRLGTRLIGVRRMWEKLSDSSEPDDALEAMGWKRARLIVATSFRLFTGKNPVGLTPEETTLVDQEVARVEKCEGTTPPSWLGAQDPAPYLPYSIFKPGALWGGSPMLERYHRFCKWLQEMPIPGGDPANQAMAEYLFWMDFLNMENMIQEGFQPHPDLMMGTFHAGIFEKISETRKGADFRSWITGRKNFHILGSIELPEWSVSQTLLEKNQAEWLPELVGASVGNSIAESALPRELAALAGKVPWTQGAQVFPVEALRILNQAPDPRSPKLFQSDSWRRKQLNATLGSWTEYRHAMALAAKENVHWLGETADSPGFVEPYPRFFSEMAKQASLVAKAREKPLVNRGSGMKIVLWLDECIKGIDFSGKSEVLHGSLFNRGSGIGKLVEQHALINQVFPARTDDEKVVGEHFIREGKELFELACRIRDFTRSYWEENRDSMARADEWMKFWKDPSVERLSGFADLSESLARLAEKQIAGEAWSEADKKVLTGYGAKLGKLMFYEGNSYLSPKDDAPRIVSYSTLGSEASTRIFHAAVGRPRLLFIRYPDPAGRPVLCQGAVYSFRKFEAQETPQTREWKDTENKRAWPDWTRPIVAPAIEREPDPEQ